ncbi:hypothetical protein DSM112329_04904 [Paraconexibacter sp. AEG42_29]|uniref:SbsA Ig-like domain-containing protein n=1 Tax=Paraconexibacter sp. AEG42_29 TaxID=2997339 RepID=A0AAU7B254_9ACTN
MSHRFQGRAALRTAAVSAVALASLATAGSAQAALGGGKAPALTDRPNLVSVTPSATAITFTYDRTIDCQGGACNPAEFQVGGYTANQEIVGNAATVSGSSVRVTFTGGNPDTDVLTYGRVDGDAVNTQGSLGATNLGDSVRITGSEGESGTRGHTTGPDLVSAVATGGGSNFITLTFDQDIDDAAANFLGNEVYLTRADGTLVQGIDATVSIDDNTADVEFPAGTPVAGAKLVSVNYNAARSEDFGNPSPVRSVQVGTQNQDSQAPVLKSAELTGADTILFTFDKAVSTPTPAGFYVFAADTTFSTSTSATIVGDGKQVQAQFPVDQITEYLVSAAVFPGAARAQADNTLNTFAGVPVGGNAGAKATGFTTAPDAVQADYSGANVVVTFDSRINTAAASITAANFDLIADDGTEIGGTPTATPQAQGVPGPSRVNLLYNTTSVGNARAIRIQQNAVSSLTNAQNIEQQLGR